MRINNIYKRGEIHYEAKKIFGVDFNDMAVLDLINKMSNDYDDSMYPGWCYMSKATMAEELSTSRRSVIDSIKLLELKGLIVRSKDNDGFLCLSDYADAVISFASNRFIDKIKKPFNVMNDNIPIKKDVKKRDIKANVSTKKTGLEITNLDISNNDEHSGEVCHNGTGGVCRSGTGGVCRNGTGGCAGMAHNIYNNINNNKTYSKPYNPLNQKNNFQEEKKEGFSENSGSFSNIPENFEVAEKEKEKEKIGPPKKKKKEGSVSKENMVIIESVINYFNQVTGQNRRVGANKHMINARLKEGTTEQELKSIILKKYNHWKDSDKMKQYIRPETFFGSIKKIDKYLNEPDNMQHYTVSANEKKFMEKDGIPYDVSKPGAVNYEIYESI